MAMINGGFVSDAMIEERDRKLKKILELLLNNPDGLSIKETAIDLGLPSETARKYFKRLLDDGSIKVVGKTGKTVIYAHASSTAPAAVVQERPEYIGGKTFEEVKPAIHVNQGDVIWCSSRSGDGQFFRYLVMVPWERKATVLGIFPQGHPALNLNDARFVDLGTDPETGEELYADISNTCSRGYAQFGEKLMTVDADRMNEVKSVMVRYHRIDLAAKDQPSDIWKKKAEDLVKIVKDLESKRDDLSRRLQASMKESSVNGAKVVELTEANDDLKARLNAAYLECDEKKQAWAEMNTVAKNAMDRISELDAENERLKFANESLRTSVEHIQAENKKLEESAAQHVESDVIFTEDTKETIDSLLWKISLLEKELEGKNEMITVLKQITFKSLAKGGE